MKITSDEQKLIGLAVVITAVVLVYLVASSKTMSTSAMNNLTIAGLLFSAVVSAWTLAFVNTHAKQYKAQGKEKDLLTVNILNSLYLVLIAISGAAMYKYMKG
jgi:multisubunit Na+/H+ antiporter MnhB subunit